MRLRKQLAEHSQRQFFRVVFMDGGRIGSKLAPYRDFTTLQVIVANMIFPAK
jgi:hypothetical protein